MDDRWVNDMARKVLEIWRMNVIYRYREIKNAFEVNWIEENNNIDYKL